MKARVKATGEVLEIASYATIPMECCDSFGEPLRFCLDDVEILSEGNDLKESEVPDYWTRLEHQYAGMAMQTMLATLYNPKYHKELMASYTEVDAEEVARLSKCYAHALVEKLKSSDL